MSWIDVGKDRVRIGEVIENEIKEIFGLETEPSPFSSKPDILDYNRGIVGEIKSLKRGNRVVLYTNQIRRYIKLADELNVLRSLDGARNKMSVLYYIGVYDFENPFFLNDIYQLDRNKLEQLLGYKEKNTKWALKGMFSKHAAILKDDYQTLLDTEYSKKELVQRIIASNKNGSYVRLGCKELNVMCPDMVDKHNGISIKIHS